MIVDENTLENTLEIAQMLTLSTCHVSQETSDRLPTGQGDIIDGTYVCWWPKFARAEGWLFYIPSKTDIFDDVLEEAPKDLRDVLAYARSHGCLWVMFDRDGPIVEGLYQYDW